jgi:hypothetical protein
VPRQRYGRGGGGANQCDGRGCGAGKQLGVARVEWDGRSQDSATGAAATPEISSAHTERKGKEP